MRLNRDGTTPPTVRGSVLPSSITHHVPKKTRTSLTHNRHFRLARFKDSELPGLNSEGSLSTDVEGRVSWMPFTHEKLLLVQYTSKDHTFLRHN